MNLKEELYNKIKDKEHSFEEYTNIILYSNIPVSFICNKCNILCAVYYAGFASEFVFFCNITDFNTANFCNTKQLPNCNDIIVKQIIE